MKKLPIIPQSLSANAETMGAFVQSDSSKVEDLPVLQKPKKTVGEYSSLIIGMMKAYQNVSFNSVVDIYTFNHQLYLG
jgi:hypothetical protein